MGVIGRQAGGGWEVGERWLGGGQAVVGRWVGVLGMGGQAESGPSLPLGHRQWHCAPSRGQKCTQTTG